MSIYEEIEIEDMVFDEETEIYYYPCPCGDKFNISLEELYDGEDIATCPSCTLRIRVIFDEESLPPLREDSDLNQPASIENEVNDDNRSETPSSSTVNINDNEGSKQLNKKNDENVVGNLITEKISREKDEQVVFTNIDDNKTEEISSS